MLTFHSCVKGPAPEGVTNAIYEITKTISTIRHCPDLKVDVSAVGTQQYEVEGRKFVIEVSSPN